MEREGEREGEETREGTIESGRDSHTKDKKRVVAKRGE